MADEAACSQCGEPMDAANAAVCNQCERPFHLRLRQDAEAKDCGEVWISEQHLALEFACLSCLGRAPAGLAGEPPVGGGH